MELRAHYKIHNVFHISTLEEFIVRDGEQMAPPPPGKVDGHEEKEIERILDHRITKREQKSYWRFLVKWLGEGLEEATWEPELKLNNAAEVLADYLKETGLSRDAK